MNNSWHLPPKNTPCVYSSHSSTQLNKKQCDTIESATITERNTFDPLRLWLTWEHRQTSAVLPATLTLLLQNKCVWKLQLKAFYLWIKTQQIQGPTHKSSVRLPTVCLTLYRHFRLIRRSKSSEKSVVQHRVTVELQNWVMLMTTEAAPSQTGTRRAIWKRSNPKFVQTLRF